MLNGKHLAQNEYLWVLTMTLIVVGLTALPYIVAAVAAPPNLTFGGVLVNPQDGNTYLAKIKQGYEGEWLYHLAYSPEKEPGILIYSLYIILGHLARLINLPIIWVFHGARIAAGILLLAGIYRLACELTPEISARRWGWAIAAFGSGLGLVSQIMGRAIAGNIPTDFYNPQFSNFYSILTNPHFPLIVAFEVLAILWILKPPFPQWPKAIHWVIVALLGLGIVSLASYLAPVIGLVVAVGLLVIRPRDQSALVRAGVFGVAMGVLLTINLYQLKYNLALAAWMQNIVEPSPAIIDMLLGFGIWLPLALVGAWRVWQSDKGTTRAFLIALIAWIVGGLAAMYIPSFLQGRFAGGLPAPIAILAGVGIHWVLGQFSGLRQGVLLLLVVGLGFSTNTLIIGAAFTAPRQAQDSMYLTKDEAATFQWLDPLVTPDDLILADTRLGNFVPTWTGARTVYGHSMETTSAAQTLAEVEDYYAQGTNPALLDKYNVKYIVGGQLPPGWKIVYRNSTMTVYGQ